MKAGSAVSAGLDLIAQRKRSPGLGKFLELLDDIDLVVGDDKDGQDGKPIRRPYSGQELKTTETWK
jgi:hypothetical protein